MELRLKTGIAAAQLVWGEPMKDVTIAESNNFGEIESMTNLDAALFYAALGWSVFPVWSVEDGRCGCGNPNCKSPGKHPLERLTGDWRLSATTDEVIIRRWWTKYPGANIATPDFLRIDVDVKHNALEIWQELVHEHGIPDTPHVFTPGGGEHWYFEPPEGSIHSNVTGNLPKGIDVRGHGTGYTLLSPSNHLNGRYEWEASSSPDLIPVAPLPDWIAELLQPTQVQETVMSQVTFSKNGTHKVDLSKFKLPELIRATIERIPELNTDRSAIDQSVICALVRAQASDDDIKAIFERYSIGTAGKLADKGKHREQYLALSISKARQVVGKPVVVTPRLPGAPVPPVSITETLDLVDLWFLEKCLKREELGDAEVFAQIYRDRIVCDHSGGRGNDWHLWTGNHWSLDATAKVKHLFSEHVSEQYVKGAIAFGKKAIAAQEAGETGKAGKYEELNSATSNRARLLRKKARSKNVLDYAATLLGITGSEWDSKPWKLAVANGVIDLSTGNIAPGEPQDYLRTAAPAEWRGLEEQLPLFEQFMLDIMGDDRVMVDYLQRLLGYSISGLTSEHVFPIFWGEAGRNGKDTLLETLGNVLGPLAGAVSKDVILDLGGRRSGGSAEPHIYDLKGKRLVWANEPHEGARLDAAQVKQITGGGRLKARPLYGNYVEWTPTHQVILVTNPRPHAAADDRALWSRIQLIPFTQRFVDKPKGPNEHTADKHLREKLREEASGILAWLVRGFLAWQDEGLNPPQLVTQATSNYQRDEDTLGQFIDECCIIADHMQTRANQMVSAYHAWCEEYGIRNPMDGRTFGMKLAQRFERKHTRSGNVYLGVGLLSM